MFSTVLSKQRLWSNVHVSMVIAAANFLNLQVRQIGHRIA